MRYFLLLLVLLGCDPSAANPAVKDEGDAVSAQDSAVDAHIPPVDGTLLDASVMVPDLGPLSPDATEVMDAITTDIDGHTSDVLPPSDEGGQDDSVLVDVMAFNDGSVDATVMPPEDATPPVLDASVVEPDAAPPPPLTCTVNNPALLCGAGCYDEQGLIVCLWTEQVIDDRCHHDYDGDGLDPAQGDCDDGNPDTAWCWNQPLPPDCATTDFVVEL